MANREGGRVEYLNPDGMAKSPAFTQAIAVTGPVKTLYIGLQHAVDEHGEIVGEGDIAAQTARILECIDHCLNAAGAERKHIIQMTVSILQGQSIQEGYPVFQSWWGQIPNPPTNNVVFVAGFGHPAWLVGVEAIAVIPAGT
jgi:enamine deaminase RidA (YjgF/YER057c/UK114 family)